MKPVSVPNSDFVSVSSTPSSIVKEGDLSCVPDISVIIVSWNSRAFLEECLESLSQGIERHYEVIVVDNDSSDGSPEAVSQKFPWVTLIQSGTNLGFAKANNVGIRQSRGRFIALINSDVKVLPECLDRLAEFMDANHGVGMVGPGIFFGDGRPQSSCRRFPSLWNNACEASGLNTAFPHSQFFAGEHMFYFRYDRTCEVDVLVGCFILARREAVADFGLLDESFFMYAEDIDWNRRAWLAGWKVMFFPGAKAIHYCGGSSRNDPLRFAVAQERSRLMLWAKHLKRHKFIGLVMLSTLGHVVRMLFSMLKVAFGRSCWRRELNIIRKHGECLRVLMDRSLLDLPSRQN